MSTQAVTETTLLLLAAAQGDADALARLMPRVYEELRALAAAQLAQERVGHTLQPTALVHEAYLRLIDQSRASWADRRHFFAAAAEAMRRILVDYARQRKAQKRGGDMQRVGLDSAVLLAVESPVDMVALGEALDRLSTLDERKRRVVELRFFGGLTNDEVAEVLGVGRATVANDWTVARAWLRAELGEAEAP